MSRARLVSGGLGRRRKGKTWANMTAEERKNIVRWVTMTEIKNATGLSLKDLRLILSECNLWSKKLPSRYAVEYRMARWNWRDKRYEWNREATLNRISEYVKDMNEQQLWQKRRTASE